MLKLIYIVESLVPKDGPIGQRLAIILNRRGVITHFRPITCRKELDAALAEVLTSMQNPDNSPVAVQLICHGNEEGIGLSNDKLVEWETLRQQFRSIYEAANRTFHLYLASCFGIAVSKLLAKKEPCPFTSLCGSGRPLRPRDAFDGLLHFYDRILMGETPEVAANSVNISVGGFDMQAHDSYRLRDNAAAKLIRNDYVELMQDAAVDRWKPAMDAGLISEADLRERFSRERFKRGTDEQEQAFKS